MSKALNGDLEISEATRMRVYGAGLEPGPTLERRAFADVCGALQALPGGYQPDGICANDTVGYTVLQALVLETLAVVGYDGTTDAERRKVRRSTVAVDKLGAAGVRLLLERVARPGSLPWQIVVPTRLEPGDTS